MIIRLIEPYYPLGSMLCSALVPLCVGVFLSFFLVAILGVFRHFSPFGRFRRCSPLSPLRRCSLIAISSLLFSLTLATLNSPKITKPRQLVLSRLVLSGGCLLSHLRSTIGVTGLNFSVRDGKRWIPGAITTLMCLLLSQYGGSLNDVSFFLFSRY